MKLRNKKTEEIIDLSKGSIKETCFGTKIQLQAKDRHNKPIWVYNSLGELNEVWEDYEEPKEYYFIRDDGSSVGYSPIGNSTVAKRREEIGNYFLSREEAELALRKLKAWKRLKDNGYKFNGIGVEYDGYKIYLKCDIMKKEHYTPTQDHKDLDLLFSGED